MSAAVTIQGVTHRFGSLTALDAVDLTITGGEVHAILGRNGAGKSTLIRTMLGLLVPDAGRIEVLGTAVAGGRTPSELWRRVGYLVEGPGLYPQLTVADHLGIASGYRGLSPSAAASVVELLSLGPYQEVRARALSLGNRQRLGLALALVHQPDLLILDEPTNGLDPAGVAEIRTLLRSLAAAGTTVVMSSHLISEVVRSADRVAILHQGRLLEELPTELLAAGEPIGLTLTFRSAATAAGSISALAASGIPATTDGAVVTSTSPWAVEHPDEVITRLVHAGKAPIGVAVAHEDLEQRFLRITAGINDEPAAAAATAAQS